MKTTSATSRWPGRIARLRRGTCSGVLAAAVLIATLAPAQEPSGRSEATITPNYKDADLGQIVEAVSEITGKNFIIDPRVRAQVTMLSSSPMTPEAFYEAFLSILQVHGFVAVPAGDVIKIIPDANARQVPANDLPQRVPSGSDELVTQVIEVKNVSAAQLVPVLRPLLPQYAHLAAYPASNMLIISDRASNVHRLMRIIGRIDQVGDEEIDVIPLEHASAAEIVRVVNVLYPAAASEAGTGVKLVADERTNSVLVSGETNKRLQLKTLITHLDTPLETGGDTQVRYLRYADAEKMAAKLKEQASATIATTGGGPPGQAPGAAGGGAAQLDRNVTLWAEPETNALVVTAPPKVMRSLMGIIDKLDIPRLQVQVEAIIVEITADKAADLGVNWVIDGSNDDDPVGGFIQDIRGADIADVANAANTGQNIPSGFTVGIGRLRDTGLNFAAMLRALRSDADTNVISTPSVVTMDNQEAEIKVAQEVPFLTGQFTNTGQQPGTVTPFQTIQRQEVGTILKITPQISEGDTVILKIEQEQSNLSASSQAVDLITNKRTITTNVLVEDGGVIVLGGLISEDLREREDRVPYLGRIPLIGELFKVRSSQKVKTNLMVFIRPSILRDGEQTAIATNSKYDLMRREQERTRGGKRIWMLPQETRPTLKPLPERKPRETPPQSSPESLPSGSTPPDAASSPDAGAQTAPAPRPVQPRARHDISRPTQPENEPDEADEPPAPPETPPQ